ncbi:MAG: flagellar protein FlgN [Phycisphaerae bacterium]|jgi:hypothetical protein
MPTIAQAQRAVSSMGDEAALRGELLGTLGDLREQLNTLIEMADRKLAAMRVADAQALHALAAEEGRLVREHYETDRRRRACVARLAQQLPVAGARPRTLTEVAGLVPEPDASRIRSHCEGLRRVAEMLQRKNRIVFRVARDLHTHIGAVVADVAMAQQEPAGYGPAGRELRRTRQLLVDAVG